VINGTEYYDITVYEKVYVDYYPCSMWYYKNADADSLKADGCFYLLPSKEACESGRGCNYRRKYEYNNKYGQNNLTACYDDRLGNGGQFCSQCYGPYCSEMYVSRLQELV
jgi:hypothetical protein